jgi:5-hydroxyisourate hydrolase-like protein (transthyretin family)
MVAAFSSFAVADSITGTVTNKTTNKPAAGDDVVLIRLQQGMQEAARTKTDSKGRFTLEVPANESQAIHLVRVTHDKANYFRPAPPGTQSVEVDVYNAAAKVKGVSSEADVMRLQTDESGKALHVVENFFVKNDSNPPLTQFSDRPFEFYLPDGAVVEGSAALSPGGMPVQASPVPLGEPNHFAFIFPIRPGVRLLTGCRIAGA